MATGVGALDRVLPGGGLPRGRLSVWAPGGGATAVLRSACVAGVDRGERVAWVDGSGVLASVFGGDAAPLVLRPSGRREALECAEELARSGGYGLVVVAGVETLGGEAVRLSRAVREGGGALVALAREASVAALRLASRIVVEACRWRRGILDEPVAIESVRIEARVRAMGANARAEFELPVEDHEVRLCMEPGLADRRGVRR